ncbi:MAG: hypothetical protein CM1200mP41_26510 [Gammaproteobacteria bacterium]|nr:MAG: hypothetical protein CM1200mP41_26510 [Gammaproteobacteria bacterium]
MVEIYGLIHLSDLSWDETGEDVARNYNKGDEVTAVVLAVDADRERISLGLKQSQSDPFVTFVSENPKRGLLVKGTVESVDGRRQRLNWLMVWKACCGRQNFRAITLKTRECYLTKEMLSKSR